jgi:hypothetical protein
VLQKNEKKLHHSHVLQSAMHGVLGLLTTKFSDQATGIGDPGAPAMTG